MGSGAGRATHGGKWSFALPWGAAGLDGRPQSELLRPAGQTVTRSPCASSWESVPGGPRHWHRWFQKSRAESTEPDAFRGEACGRGHPPAQPPRPPGHSPPRSQQGPTAAASPPEQSGSPPGPGSPLADDRTAHSFAQTVVFAPLCGASADQEALPELAGQALEGAHASCQHPGAQSTAEVLAHQGGGRTSKNTREAV